jgi:hypothetical protein
MLVRELLGAVRVTREEQRARGAKLLIWLWEAMRVLSSGRGSTPDKLQK